MSKPGKKSVDAHRRFDREQEFAPTEALELVKTMATRNFDETVEAAVRLGVDPRKAEQMIRGTVSLPHGTGKTVAEFKAGKVEYRTDRYGNVHVPVGKASFDTSALLENYHSVLDELLRAKPAASKGRYLKAVTVSSTMGPGVKIDPTVTRLEEPVKAAGE